MVDFGKKASKASEKPLTPLIAQFSGNLHPELGALAPSELHAQHIPLSV